MEWYVINFLLIFQLLRSSLVNNRTQATVCEELGMTEFVITDDNHLDTRLPVHHLRTKHKADLLEGKDNFEAMPFKYYLVPVFQKL